MGNSSVQDFYAQSGSGDEIAHRIVDALRVAADTAVEITPETLVPFDHVHARGIVGTRALAALLQPKSGEAVLDIGSGIGGPARWFATNYRQFLSAGKGVREVARLAGISAAACSRLKSLMRSARPNI